MIRSAQGAPGGATLLATGGNGAPKRASQVADQIVEEVMGRGWPVGEVLGAENDLAERYGVSRAVFREAVRLLEHREVARTRRGPGGGLVITEPTVDAVIDAVVLYLHRVDARLDEVFEARIVLEEIACDLAARRLDEGELLRLRNFLDEASPEHARSPRGLHSFLAASSHNPAIELFVEVLNRVAGLYSAKWMIDEAGAETAHAHARIAEAVIAGDSATARRRMRIHLQAESDYIRRRRTTRQILPDSILTEYAGSGKLAEGVARRIARSVVTGDLVPGQLIGTETDLIEREGVSRAVFREAVRLLEYHSIAHMRRGPGGGLFVAEPSVGAVTDIVAVLLARRRMNLDQLSELRLEVETVAVSLTVKRIDDAGRHRVEAALEREAETGARDRSEAVHGLHAAVAGTAGNRVLELMALVLIRLSRLYQVERFAERDADRMRAEVQRAHTAIADAILAGDPDLARHRMQRHLAALASTLR